MGGVFSVLYHYKNRILQYQKAALKPSENMSDKLFVVKLRCSLNLNSPVEVF